MSVTIYGQPNCAFCERAKMLCQMKGVEYVYNTLNVDYTKDELLKLIPATHRTFPAIFVDGAFIGGYAQLNEKLNG